jgi:cytochrome P450
MDAADAVQMLLSPRPDRDPYPAYDALRAYGPVLRLGGTWFVSGYAAADAVLRDPAMIAYDSGLLDEQWSDWRANRAVALFADSMLRQNPPNHTRMRRLASGVFTARRVGRLREVIAAQVDAILDDWQGLDEMAARGVVDVVSDLAYPPPTGDDSGGWPRI